MVHTHPLNETTLKYAFVLFVQVIAVGNPQAAARAVMVAIHTYTCLLCNRRPDGTVKTNGVGTNVTNATFNHGPYAGIVIHMHDPDHLRRFRDPERVHWGMMGLTPNPDVFRAGVTCLACSINSDGHHRVQYSCMSAITAADHFASPGHAQRVLEGRVAAYQAAAHGNCACAW
jgi:hypothetical protein